MDTNDELSDDTTNRYWSPWDNRFIFELALGLDPVGEVCSRYGVTPTKLAQFRKLPLFNEQIKTARSEIREKGLTFREKAKVMAEDLLGTAYSLAQDPRVTGQTRLDTIKWISKMANLEPAEKPKDGEVSNLLPAIAKRIKDIPDDELEIQVFRVVQKQKQQSKQEDVIIEDAEYTQEPRTQQDHTHAPRPQGNKVPITLQVPDVARNTP